MSDGDRSRRVDDDHEGAFLSRLERRGHHVVDPSWQVLQLHIAVSLPAILNLIILHSVKSSRTHGDYNIQIEYNGLSGDSLYQEKKSYAI